MFTQKYTESFRSAKTALQLFSFAKEQRGTGQVQLTALVLLRPAILSLSFTPANLFRLHDISSPTISNVVDSITSCFPKSTVESTIQHKVFPENHVTTRFLVRFPSRRPVPVFGQLFGFLPIQNTDERTFRSQGPGRETDEIPLNDKTWNANDEKEERCDRAAVLIHVIDYPMTPWESTGLEI